jgi:hypothetical protein
MPEIFPSSKGLPMKFAIPAIITALPLVACGEF